MTRVAKKTKRSWTYTRENGVDSPNSFLHCSFSIECFHHVTLYDIIVEVVYDLRADYVVQTMSCRHQWQAESQNFPPMLTG